MRTLKLDFVEAQNVAQSDISIMWAEGEHGDAYPFDGRKRFSLASDLSKTILKRIRF